MDVLYNVTEAFKRSLPPPLDGYWVELLVSVALLGILLFLAVVWCLLRRKAKGRNVCLLGLSNSGKSLLFLQLRFGRNVPTYNSIVENSQPYEPSNVKNCKPVVLIDIPGSERVRERIFSKYKESLRGIILVVDSLNFPTELHDVAELLYDLLSDPVFHSTKAPLLVACNKQDIALASPPEKIMAQLEKQITQLQVSRQAKPSALDGGPKAQKPVEFIKKGKDFSFTDLPSWMGVRFVGCSARGQGVGAGEEGKGSAEVKEVQEWLDGLCY